MRSRRCLVMTALAILASAMFCSSAGAESYLVCEDKDGVCPKCDLKRKIECWGGIPGTAAGAIYQCGKISVGATRGGSESLYCYPDGCWQRHQNYWPLYQNMCNTMYKDCCERTSSGRCSVFYKHPMTGNKYGYPQGYRPPGQ
jgi:hypothetical protein